MNYPETLEQLCSIPAPSGFETPAAQAALELLRPLVDEAWIDKMGNVVGVRRCGKEGARKLILDAHLDEIGFIVTGHQDGFLRFAPLGGVDPRMLPDRELTILSDPPAYGVVACLPPHIQSREDMDQAIPIKDLFLDVGLTQEEAQRRIPVGTPAVYRTGCRNLGDKLLCGKALDDRACFAVLLDTAEQLKDAELDVDLYLLGSTQEETHSTGAITAAYGSGFLRGGGRDPRGLPGRVQGKDLPPGEGAGDRPGPQLHQMDVQAHGTKSPGAGAVRAVRGDGRLLRHQRLAHADHPGGDRHGGAVRPPAVYAHPH